MDMKSLKWDLDDILPVGKFDHLYQETALAIGRIDELLKKLSPDMPEAEFAEIINFEENLTSKLMRLYELPSLMESVDEKSEKAKFLKNRAKDLYLQFIDKKRPLEHWIKGKEVSGFKKLDDANAQRLFAALPDLAYVLGYEREAAKHTLTEREEKIMTEKSANGEDVLIDLRELLETELSFSFKPYKNKPARIIKRPELMSHVSSKIPAFRKAAYEALFSKYKDNLDKFFMIYQGVVKNWVNEAKLRGFKSPIAMRNFANHIPDRAIEALLDVSAKNADVFQRYFKWKGRELALELGQKRKTVKLSRFDLYAPIHKTDRKITLPEAIKLVLNTFQEFSPKFAGLAKQIIDEKHVDSNPGPTKRDGAFCATVGPEITPYVLLNYTGRSRDVSTLAHELGHGVHSLYANSHSISSQHANLPLSETASTLGELILFEKMLAREKNPKIRKGMLSDKISEAYATILRQNYFVRFEIKAHDEITKGISSEDLSNLWLDTLKEQFGDSVKVDPVFKYEWANIPHIVSTPFYCYAYNFGELLSLALFKKYKVEGALFAKKIEKLLAYGGSKNPVDALQEIGVDISSPDFWQDSFETIKKWQEELEKL